MIQQCVVLAGYGTDVDQQLIQFAADVAWLEQHKWLIERFNLMQQPLEFANNPQVSAFLMRSGEAGLPLILVDNEIVLAGRYAKREELALGRCHNGTSNH